MSKFPESQHNDATISAPNALILSAMGLLNGSARKKETSTSAVFPFFAPQFPNLTLAVGGEYKLHRFTNSLKSPPTPPEDTAETTIWAP